MDFGEAFTFVFDDPDWLRKVALNALIGLIPIIGALYLLGWGLEVAKRVATRSPEPLPDVDFGTYLAHGARAFVVSLVYTAPLWGLNLIAAVLFMTVREPNWEAANAVTLIGSICGGVFVFVLVLFMGLVLPAAMTRSAVFGSIKAGLELKTVWAMVRATPGAYLLVLFGTWLAGMLAGIVGSLACGVGVIFTMAYYQAVMGHFYGQAYRLSGSRV